ncbi:hypothetical protein F5Y13DRAFT_207441 [Hypoxylon sp. FL1857]|nr:hypothetical protein F5Y13DRAFT_207441 [Hypoxylon sp. FL1857]
MFNPGLTRGKRNHTAIRARERRTFRRRRRQIGPSNTSINIPAESRREQYTVDEPIRANSQRQGQLSLEITSTGLNGTQHHPKQDQEINNYEPSSTPPHGENSEQLANDTFFGQQATDGYGYATLEALDLHIGNHAHHTAPNQAETQPPVAIYSDLGEYVAQEQAVPNFTLEIWRAQSSRDGPLRIVPELLGFSDWNYRLGNGYDRESDTGATGGRTP